MNDVTFAIRQLLKHRGFTATALLTLALGVGANTAIFSVVYGVLLRPLPYPEQERLITLSEWSKQVPGMSVSYPNFLDWRARQNCFTAVGVSRRQSFHWMGNRGAERVSATMASHDLYIALGVPALRGRFFGMADDWAGAERTVMLSEGFWRRNFGGRDSAIGEKIQLSGDFYTIVGVLPDALRSLESTDLAVPLGLWSDEYRHRGNHPGLYGIARMKPGVTIDKAETEMRVLASQLAEEYPVTNTGLSVELHRLSDSAFGSVKTPLLVLLGSAGFVLLIACANIANLQLSRAQARSREFAVRAALGAGRGRVIRQLLVESLLLGLLGSVAGLIVGGWALDGLRAYVPTSIPRLDEVDLNGWVLAFTICAGILTSLVFGLAPASHAARQNPWLALSASPRAGGGAGGRRWRATLIAGEFALTCLLVIGASLMLRTLANLYRANLGYSNAHVMTFDFELAGPDHQQPLQRSSLMAAAKERLGAIPGVTHVSFASPLPMRGGNQSTYYVEGAPASAPGEAPSAERIQVHGDYFVTLGIPWVAGRTFGPQDAASTPRVAVVDTVFVSKNFPGRNPIGQRFAYGDKPPTQDSDWMEIIGVVGHIRNFGPREATREQTYVAASQTAPGGGSFALRSGRDPVVLAPAVRTAMREVARDLPLHNFRTMADRFASSIATERMTMMLLGVFAVLALLLAAVGLYGVLSYTTQQRTREIGVRVALGAAPGSVSILIVRYGLKLAGSGLLLGLLAAWGLTRFLRGVLYEVSPLDTLSFTIVVIVLAGIGLFACWLPARRAARVDPMTALRQE